VPRGVPNIAKLAWVPSRAPLPVRLLKLYVGIDRRRVAEHIPLPMLSQRVRKEEARLFRPQVPHQLWP
jgi:hypothetical protein